MIIDAFVWPDDRIEHIARHGVTPEEVEEACRGRPLVLRAKSRGAHPVYYVLGQTDAGRYLFCVVIRFPDGIGYPVTARPMTDKEKTPLQAVEKTMSAKHLPKTDSIEELARFWDAHDLTDFEDELEEVPGAVFSPDTAITVRLPRSEADSVRQIAHSQGLAEAELIRTWVLERLHAS